MGNRFEYLHKPCTPGPLLPIELNQLGSDGWELVSVLTVKNPKYIVDTWHYIFKRKVNESN